MIKKILLIAFVLNCSFYKAQTDSIALKVISPNSDTLPKENTEVLKPSEIAAIPPTPVEEPKKEKSTEPTTLGEIFKPKISLGVGMLSFHGDLYANHYQAPWTGRIGYDFNLSQRLSKAFQLNFNILFGKLGANEWVTGRQQNFESEIRSGGISLMYDFGNFINDKYRLRPWVSVGINSLEFLSKTDLRDKNGSLYYYWSDGSIKNIDENAVNAASAINLTRDYTYETDIRELNKDGFGKYQERAWSFPIGFGALLKITDRFDLKMGMQYYFTTTDYIDGITNNSIGTRAGNKQKDNFVYTSFALQYDLVLNKKAKDDTLSNDYFDGVDFFAIDNADSDGDGVKDMIDKCHGTPKEVKVDEFGCPLDDDKDGVSNYADLELTTPLEMAVNKDGVSLDDAYWQNWYNQYNDSGQNVKKEIIDNIYADKKDTTYKPGDKLYTVELARFNGPVPNDEMSYLLSVGDVRSSLLPDGSTVLYTAGNYKEIQNAVKRRDEFIKEGNKNAKIGYFTGGDFTEMYDDEIAKMMEGTNSTNSEDNTNEFAKGDIVYRVQLGAYRNRISKDIFKKAGNVLELKGDDGLYHYTTKGFKTMESSASTRADLLIDGYGDAFITAYKDKKRIPLSATKATMETKEIENITEIKSFSSIDKTQITFKVQLGALHKMGSHEMDEKIKEIPDWERQNTETGMVRYMSGSFKDLKAAEKYNEELTNKGFTEAFVIAIFKGDVISLQEAKELLK